MANTPTSLGFPYSECRAIRYHTFIGTIRPAQNTAPPTKRVLREDSPDPIEERED